MKSQENCYLAMVLQCFGRRKMAGGATEAAEVSVSINDSAMANIYSERVAAIRALMMENGWDAVVISASDPHASEYPAPRWQQVRWVSGFTGEAGDIVITADEAGLWTDSRYFIQAENQLEGTGIELHKTRMPDSVPVPQWLASRASVVALDGKCMSADAVAEIESALSSASGGERPYRVADVPDMLDRLWEGRPHIPVSPIITLDEDMTGESRLHKIAWLRKFLLREECDSILLSSLDEIAWLLNVRGSDIAYNPLVISYLYVSLDKVCWYVLKNMQCRRDQDTEDSILELEGDGVEVLPYDDVFIGLSDMENTGEKIFADTSTLNHNLYRYIAGSNGEENIVRGISPVPLRKSVKNIREIEGMKEAFLEDGIAMEKFLYWLESQVHSGVTEWEASEKLTSLRSEIAGYRGDSFENISAYGPNAALPHYSTPESGSAVIKPHGLYLVDSGGQYIFGTTDITRTVPTGECSPLEKEDYTLVLKGMIRLSMAVFPEGTAGCRLDVLARNALWRSRRNFGHGTGHGIGFFLGVHEGPQSIRQNLNPQPMLRGMITSNEPGIYRKGMHGVRHENVVLCVGAGSNDFGDWLEFETLTLCHIDTSAIVPELMDRDETRWLNDYNRRVYDTLSPHLPCEVAEWLYKKTLPLQG